MIATSAAVDSQRLAGLHVLVVDDDGDARAIYRILLEHAGALVTTAASARAALRVLRHVRPDVIVADLAMPKQNGNWLIRQLRALQSRKGGDIPALAVTAYDVTYGETESLRSGFQEYLVKPVGIRELAETIERVIVAYRHGRR
jgi:CheY-like chemotaxis protein